MVVKKKGLKPKVKVLRIAKLSPTKVALDIEVEGAPELPAETLAEPLELNTETDQPSSSGWRNWLDWVFGR